MSGSASGRRAVQLIRSDLFRRIIFTSMGFIAHSPPNYAAAAASYGIGIGPVVKQVFVSADLSSKGETDLCSYANILAHEAFATQSTAS